ncbi:hypothetical protein [Limnohabitans sp.]|uniref:hypothetical protein n=1 Tax=Limnohabitans sp. TaxID=1907725 RepID=UPI0025C1CC81|nr:hypothetical protein [Limnohabitans sp.]
MPSRNEKPWLGVDEQLTKLVERGMSITDQSKAREVLDFSQCVNAGAVMVSGQRKTPKQLCAKVHYRRGPCCKKSTKSADGYSKPAIKKPSICYLGREKTTRTIGKTSNNSMTCVIGCYL